jgi:uroporphyrin-3 C-methyltransferase
MSDEVNNKQLSKTEKTSKESSEKSSSLFTRWLLILVFLFAAGLSAIAYTQWNKLEDAAGRTSSSLTLLKTEFATVTKSLSAVKQENQQLHQELVAQQKQQQGFDISLQSMNLQQDSVNDDWKLAEVEYLLIIAIHRLQLEGDVSMALAALQAADDRLRDSSDPRQLPIRQKLANDMNALKAVNKVDISGLVLFLSDLVKRVTDLPLQQVLINADLEEKGIVVEEQSGKWAQLKSAVWQELKDLVLISRRGEETLATLMPEQQYFLYQNLRLQLESARYAVLRRDTENLRVSIEIISNWLNSYFDSSDSSVANILDSLSQMEMLELNPALPDISESLVTLRASMKAQTQLPSVDQEQLLQPEQ